MNLLAEESIDINKPVSVVFNYVSNMEKFGNWFPEVISIESANELIHGEVGKKYLEKVKVPLRGEKKITLTVKEVKANQKFVTEGEFPPLLPRMEITLSEYDPESCSINWCMYSRNSNPFIRILLLPLVRRIIKKRAAIGVRNLKHELET